MVLEAIRNRLSIRSYRPQPVEREKLERVLEAARLAPTARNQQDWRIVVIDEPALRDRLVDHAAPHQPFLKEAPVLLAACSTNPDYIMRCGHPAFLVDLGIVLEHIALQAAAEGLGTCWIGSFDQEPVRQILGIPPGVPVVELMSLGYPATHPQPRPRKSSSALFSWNKW